MTAHEFRNVTDQIQAEQKEVNSCECLLYCDIITRILVPSISTNDPSERIIYTATKSKDSKILNEKANWITESLGRFNK